MPVVELPKRNRPSPLKFAWLALLMFAAFLLTQSGQAVLIGFGIFALVLTPLGFLAGAVLKVMDRR